MSHVDAFTNADQLSQTGQRNGVPIAGGAGGMMGGDASQAGATNVGGGEI